MNDSYQQQQVRSDILQDTVLNNLCEGVYIVDRERRIMFWNQAAERLSGFSADQVMGRRCADGILKHCNSQGKCLCGNGCPLQAVMRDGEVHQAHVFMHHAEGHRVPVHVRGAPLLDQENRIIGAVEIFSDDTERISAIDRIKQLERDSVIDELTGLPNRRHFKRMIDACFSSYERYGHPFGLLILDIDHFKKFNDSYGHLMGDQVLKLVSKTLSHNCRPEDTPFRWGGEEFLLLAENVDHDGLVLLAERLRSLIGSALVIPGDDAAHMLDRADALLYESKENGRNRVTIRPQVEAA